MPDTQPEIPNMPEKSPIGKAASELLAEWETLQAQKEKVSKAKEKLLPMMKKAGKLEFKIGGRIIKYRETAEGITVAKEPNKE